MKKTAVLLYPQFSEYELREEAINQAGVFEMENYSKELVVQDGNIITARGRGLIRFGKYVGNAL